jgi:hypothetical protein
MRLQDGHIAKMRRRAWCFCLLIALVPAPLLASANDRTISQFVHTAWTAKDGVPGNIAALAQTTDGFLWLGTLQGLYRFDGVSFELYHRSVNALGRTHRNGPGATQSESSARITRQASGCSADCGCGAGSAFVSRAINPVRVARAFASAMRAGRSGYLAGPMPVQDLAVASTPEIGKPFCGETSQFLSKETA